MRAALVLLIGAFTPADEPTTAGGWMRRGGEQLNKREYAEAVKSLTRALDLDRDNAEALDARGAAHFLLGKFKESAADFDRVVTLAPERANGHWRRGISLYYAGRYEDGKKQFEGYEKVDTNDVENAVWHFLCAAKKDGVEKARAAVLKIGKDRRAPMMEVYDLYRGKLKPEDVLAAAKGPKLAETERPRALFYAHLYLGIYHDLLGDAEKAKGHLAEAAGKYKIDHYMGEVARVHYELLAKKK
jgi:lipoprotein NlpI